MPTDAEWSVLVERVRGLERSQHRLKWVSVVIVVGISGAALTAGTRANTRPPAAAQRLEAEELVIKDKSGRVRARLGTNEAMWGRQGGSSTQQLIGRAGRPDKPTGAPCHEWHQRGAQRLSLSGGARGAGLNLGGAGVSPGALSMSAGDDGTAHVRLYDAKGLRAVLGDTKDAMKGGLPVEIEERPNASIVLFDTNGKPLFKAP